MAKKPIQALPDTILKSAKHFDPAISFFAPGLANSIKDLQQELEQVRQSSDPMAIARAFVALHHLHEVLKSIIGTDDSPGLFKSIYGPFKSEVVPNVFEDKGIDKTLPLTEGYRVTVSTRLYASLPAANKQRGMEWLRKNGLGDLIQETVNAQTLSATAATMMEDEGKELPEDIFSVHMKYNTSAVRTK